MVCCSNWAGNENIFYYVLSSKQSVEASIYCGVFKKRNPKLHSTIGAHGVLQNILPILSSQQFCVVCVCVCVSGGGQEQLIGPGPAKEIHSRVWIGSQIFSPCLGKVHKCNLEHLEFLFPYCFACVKKIECIEIFFLKEIEWWLWR